LIAFLDGAGEHWHVVNADGTGGLGLIDELRVAAWRAEQRLRIPEEVSGILTTPAARLASQVFKEHDAGPHAIRDKGSG
jgi:hypothetical protein